MDGEWRTYAQVAEQLHTTVEGARQRAIRGRWRKTIGNDKLVRVMPPDGWTDAVRTPKAKTVRTPDEHAQNTVLISALHDHLTTMREQLSDAQARVTESQSRIGELTAALEGRDAQHLALIAEERSRTSAAIQAFADLAARLDMLANQQRPKPWWRRFG
jgi:hypothetical protein